jgi:two-component system, NarL family, invasion response regulator UvrY
MPKHTVALVDDHKLLTESLAALINKFPDYTVVMQASNGFDMKEKLKDPTARPDIVLLDISMPGMDGYDTARWLRGHHPETKVLAVSTHTDEAAILKMLRLGCKGYITKEMRPSELKRALDEVVRNGYHHTENLTGRLLRALQEEPKENIISTMTDREIEFLILSGSEMTYKEIAEQMSLSPKTIDGYRDTLFDKLGVKNRIGLVIFAIKHGLVKI